MKLVARAKLNLHLRVLGKRPDGFHEIESVMQSIELADEIEIDYADDVKVEITWAPGLTGPIPYPPDLVEKAIRSFPLMGAGGRTFAAKVVKRIPVASGLAGGSADAAAALRAMQWMTKSQADLDYIGASIGSDIPFALNGGTALATGRGEVLKPIRTNSQLWWVIAVPPVQLSTRDIYTYVDHLARPPEPQRTIDGLIRGLASDNFSDIAANLHNDLEVAATTVYPKMRELRQLLLDSGAAGVVMSGSGPTLAGLASTLAEAHGIAEAVRPEFSRVEIVKNALSGVEAIPDGQEPRATLRQSW